MDSYFSDFQATDSFKLGVTQASLERDKAVRELARLRRELDQEENDREHVCTCICFKFPFLVLFYLLFSLFNLIYSKNSIHFPRRGID